LVDARGEHEPADGFARTGFFGTDHDLVGGDGSVFTRR
jgi:hypothetical protein